MSINFSRLAITSFALLFSKLSLATPVSINTGYQLEGLGYFSATLDYVASSSTRSSLTVIINNLPTTASGGRITGVAFNKPTGATFSSMTSTAPNSSFEKLDPSNNDIETSGLGDFDFGSSVGGSWLEDSSASAGIAAGSSGTFVFKFRGTNLNTLSTLSFINAVAPNNGTSPPQFMAVRFRGFTLLSNSSHSGEDSESGDDGEEDSDHEDGEDNYYIYFDEVGGTTNVTPSPVPVPASVWLMLSGLGGLGLFSRRKSTRP